VTQVGGTLGLDHIERHTQRNLSVDRTLAGGDLAVSVLDDDLVAEIPRRMTAGVGDQGLFGGQLQLELSPRNAASCSLIFSASAFGPMNPKRWSSA